MTFVKFVFLFTIVFWLGGMFFFSIIAAPNIFRALPKDQAGQVMGKIFPKYFIIGLAGSTLALVTLAIIGIKSDSMEIVKAPLIILGAMVLISLISGLIIGPKARAIKAEYHSLPEGKERDELESRFQKTHRVSIILNGINMLIGLTLIFFISKLIHLK